MKRFLKGILIGAGGIAPGVSGGVLAIILGLYEGIIEAVSSIFKKPVKSIRFLLPIGVGLAIGIVLFSNVQRVLLKSFEFQTLYLFMGLIVGSLPFLVKAAGEKEAFSLRSGIVLIIALAVGVTMALVSEGDVSIAKESIQMNVWMFVKLMGIGFALSSSIFMPGVSGTVVLALIGAYGIVINALADLKNLLGVPFGSSDMMQEALHNILVLIPLAIGVGVGTIFFAKVVKFLLHRFHTPTYWAMVGLVGGSVVKLFPGFAFDLKTLTGVLLFVVGVAVAIWFGRFEEKQEKAELYEVL